MAHHVLAIEREDERGLAVCADGKISAERKVGYTFVVGRSTEGLLLLTSLAEERKNELEFSVVDQRTLRNTFSRRVTMPEKYFALNSSIGPYAGVAQRGRDEVAFVAAKFDEAQRPVFAIAVANLSKNSVEFVSFPAVLNIPFIYGAQDGRVFLENPPISTIHEFKESKLSPIITPDMVKALQNNPNAAPDFADIGRSYHFGPLLISAVGRAQRSGLAFKRNGQPVLLEIPYHSPQVLRTVRLLPNRDGYSVMVAAPGENQSDAIVYSYNFSEAGKELGRDKVVAQGDLSILETADSYFFVEDGKTKGTIVTVTGGKLVRDEIALNHGPRDFLVLLLSSG